MSHQSLLTIALFGSALLTVLLQSANGAGVGDHILQRDAAADPIPGLWLSDLFYRALANFTLLRANGTACRRQSAMYEAHLRNHTSWAVDIFTTRSDLLRCHVTPFYKNISYQQNTNENGEQYINSCILSDTGEVSSSFLNEFSLIESIKTLLKFNKDNKLNFFYTLKVMTMLPIMYGHKLFIFMSYPISNPKFIEIKYLNGPAILMTGLNIVDPFFFISGFILYMNLSREFRKPKAESVWKTLSLPIIQRIIKILPAYCAMMAITAHFVPHLGDGPLWPHKSWEEAEICKNYWWTNLLFISNFVDVKHQCLIMSWYLSCDIQFFIIGVIVIYIYTKNPKYGITLLGTILGLSISVPFIITLLTGRDGMDKLSIPHIMYPRNILSLNESYRPSYMRATPFFGGLAMSFVVEKLKEKKVKFSQTAVHGGVFAICTFTLWVQSYGFVFYTRNRSYYPLEHALYSTICHCTWAVAGIWITISYFTSGYGLLENLFHNRFLSIMGKLSFPVLLVNMTVMLTSQSSQRLPAHLSSRYVFEAFLYDSFMCYLTAIILYLVVYEPFSKLTTKLFDQRKSKSSSINNGTSIKKPAIYSSKTAKKD